MNTVLGFLRTIGDFAFSPVGRWIGAAVAIVLMVVAVHAHGVGQGVKREKAAEAARQAKVRKAVARREEKAEGITRQVAADLTRETVRVETVTKTIIKEVPVYVSPAADARCVVPRGFVRLLDAAAAAEVPEPARGPLDADSGLTLSSVAGSVIDNYGTANALRAEVIAWRTWYVDQAKAWGQPVQ